MCQAGRGEVCTADEDLLVLAGEERLGALQIITAQAFLDALGGT